MKSITILSLVLLLFDAKAQSYRDYKFQFNNTTKAPVRVSWEVYDVPGQGSATLLDIQGSLTDKTLRVERSKKYIKFSGKSLGFRINPVVFEIRALKKENQGVNLVDLMIEEEPKGTNIDLGNLVTNITNEHFFKLLSVDTSRRLKEDEVLQLGTFVILDEGVLPQELSRIQIPNASTEELISEFSKRSTYFVDKSHIQSYSVTAGTPKFAVGVDVSLIDSGFVEFDFRIRQLQHFVWKGTSPFDYLQTPEGRNLIAFIRTLYDRSIISNKAQVYFVSSYIKVNDLTVSQRTFDKKGRDVHGRINANLQSDLGVAVVANNSFLIKSGVIEVDSVKTARVLTSGKNVTPIIMNFITIGDNNQRIIELQSQNQNLSTSIKAFYNSIVSYKANLGQTDNIELISSNVSVLDQELYNLEPSDTSTTDEVQAIKNRIEQTKIYNKNLDDIKRQLSDYYGNINQIEIIRNRLRGATEDEIKLRENANKIVSLTTLDNRKVTKITRD